jgi:hypothetical protein
LFFVLVVLLRFDRQCSRRSARGVGVVRWIRVSLLGVPKWAGPDGLDVRKGEVLVVVQVVEDLVVRDVRGARLLEDLRVAKMTDRNTSSIVSAPM